MLGTAVVICLLICLNAGAGVAQRKKSPRKVVTNTQRPHRQPVIETREPEVELERLPSDPSVENADIAITAHVRARSLKFDQVPNPTVEFPGQPQRDTVWEADRENLPTPVQAGVTYRNIGIRLKITSVFSDIDRIVAEALGEIPVADDKTIVADTAKRSSSPPNTKPPGSQPASSRPPFRERQ
ncbi:MAG: hypothetical protein ABR556_01575 [Pyrinomonadaceae bacterium]